MYIDKFVHNTEMPGNRLYQTNPPSPNQLVQRRVYSIYFFNNFVAPWTLLPGVAAGYYTSTVYMDVRVTQLMSPALLDCQLLLCFPLTVVSKAVCTFTPQNANTLIILHVLIMYQVLLYGLVN
jgi:hypothetical protein